MSIWQHCTNFGQKLRKNCQFGNTAKTFIKKLLKVLKKAKFLKVNLATSQKYGY